MKKPKPYTSRAWLYRRFIIDGLTEQKIAEMTGADQSTINRWLKKHNIKKGP